MSKSRLEPGVSPDPELVTYLEELLGTSAKVGSSADPVARATDVSCSEQTAGPLPPGCPRWLTPVFSVGILHLAKLRFAVPGCQVYDARRIGQTLLPVAETGLTLGRLDAEGHTWLVIDTARLILPDQRLVAHYQWMVPLRQGRLALACDRVSESEAIQARQVRWRQQRQRRPWLLGMLTGDDACPLVDVNALVADLQSDFIEVKHGGSCGKKQ